MQVKPKTHLSLFSGIGGFDLAARWVGWRNVAAVEKDKFCQKVLSKNFPNISIYGDIKEFKGEKYTDKIDVISGGFPCQPFSIAGKRKGKDDDRYLWEEMFRVITEIKPSFIVCENVIGIIKLALSEVLSSLEDAGYITETFIIPACAVNAPHKRERVWIIAYSKCCADKQVPGKYEEVRNEKRLQERHKIQRVKKSTKFYANPHHLRQKGQLQKSQTQGLFSGFFTQGGWDKLPKSTIRRGDDGFSKRMDRLRGLGNAIVPHIAYEIFKCIDNVH